MSGFYTRFNGSVVVRTLNGKEFNAKMGRIDPDKVNLMVPDGAALKGNPRLWSWEQNLRKQKKIKGVLTESKMIALLLDPKISPRTHQDLTTLVSALGESGEPADPILVDANGLTYEGMRRVITSRIRKSQGDIRFNDIPCLMFEAAVSEEDWNAHIGLIHAAAAKKDWPSADRAAQCLKLRDDFVWDVGRIAKHFGWSLDKTIQYVRAGDLHVEYKKEFGDYRTTEFTKFYKAAGCQELYARMFDTTHENYDPVLWSTFKKWVRTGKITDCRHVTALTGKLFGRKIALLNYPKAVQIIENRGTTAAVEWIIQNIYADKHPIMEKSQPLIDLLERLSAAEKKQLADKTSTVGRQQRMRLQHLVDTVQQLLDTTDLDAA